MLKTKHTFLITTLLLLLPCSLYIVLSPKKEVLSSTISLNVGSTPQIKEAGLGLESLIVRGGALLSTVSGNVGIGTIIPRGKFAVSFNNEDQIVFYAPGDNRLAIQTILDGKPIGTYGGGENRLLLQPSVGRVGIGTENPGATLDVNGDVIVRGNILSGEPKSAPFLKAGGMGVDDFSLGNGSYGFNNNEHNYKTHSLPFSAGLLKVEWRHIENSVWQTVYEYGRERVMFRYGHPTQGWNEWKEYVIK